jgi:GNAT superfamily N-acetyltransferase
MFTAMGEPSDKLEAMGRAFAAWVVPKLADESYLGWLTFDGEHPVASAGLLLVDWPPQPFVQKSTLRGYIFGVFVEAGHRRRGLARALLNTCIEETARRGIHTVTLHASDDGRPLYKSLGFAATNEMSLTVARP